MDASSLLKINNLTDNIGCGYSGLGPDSRVLVKKGRKQAEEYFRVYQEPAPVAQCVRELATIMQEYTQSGCASPSPLARPSGLARALRQSLVPACPLPVGPRLAVVCRY